MNYKFYISYKGTAYSGFQVQPNRDTIQGRLAKALSAVTRAAVNPHGVIGCGRTDAGVHARKYCFNFHTDARIPTDAFARALNGALPRDIAVLSCETADNDFHARFSANSKTYAYYFDTNAVRSPFTADTCMHYPYKLDAGRLHNAARRFVGEHDFTAFCTAEAKHRLGTDTVRKVYEISVREEQGGGSPAGSTVCMKISGNGFLHNMVRIICGTLVYVNEGKLAEEDITRLLENGRREGAGVTLPPHGLFLEDVKYN